MEVNTQYYPWPSQGWAPKCEQDFRQGAKGLNSPHVSSTPPTSAIFNENFQDWEIRDALGCGELEAFSEVILPDSHNFGPEDLFDGLPDTPACWTETTSFKFYEEGFQDEFPFNSALHSIKPECDIVEASPPPITIKLKRVSLSKTRKYYSVHDTKPTIPPTATNDFDSFQTEFMLASDSCDDNAMDNIKSAHEETFPYTTLKDLMNMEDADQILENYMCQGSSSVSNEIDMYTSEASPSGTLSPSPSDFSTMSPFSSNEVYSLASSPLLDDSSQRKNERSDSRQERRKPKLSAESRYLRKKEQNKQAALRYRSKKKQEDEILTKELEEEERTKDNLEKTCKSLSREISFMKKLMLETLISRGIVPPSALE